MPQPNPFRYTLIYNGVDTVLEHAPEGWRDYGVEWQRDRKWHGFSRKYTDSLRFVLEARDVIRQAFTDSGIEALVLFKIERNNPKDWEYYTDYVFELDFSTLKDTELYCEITAITGGLAKLINANADKEYEIPITEEYKINVPDGIYMPEDIRYILNPIGMSLAYTLGYPAFSLIAGGAKTPSMRFKDVTGLSPNYMGRMFNKTDDIPVSVNIKCQFKALCSKVGVMSVPCSFRVILYNTVQLLANYITLFSQDISLDEEQLSEIDIYIDTAITLTLQAEYTFACTIYDEGGGFHYPDVYYAFESKITTGEPDLTFTYNGHTKPFTFYGMPLWRLHEKLIEKVTDGQHPAQSNLLKNDINKYLFATSGDGVRDVRDKDGNLTAQIKISLKNFIDSVNCMLLTGFGDENIGGTEFAVLEQADYFFNPDSEIMDVGEVSFLEISPQFDLFANRISIGYPNKGYDEDNGRDEFNITLNFGMNMKRTDANLDLVSKIRADSYGIQFTRMNYTPEETGDENSRTKDSTADNEPFVVHVKPATDGRTGYDVNKDIDIIEGSVNAQGVFNAYLSPKRCMLRHASWLAAILDKQAGEIEFLSSERQDSNLTSQWMGIEPSAIVEKNNIPISALGKKIFLPYIAKFTTLVPREMHSLVEGGKIHGYIAFTYNGVKFKGFPVKISEMPAVNRQQEWTLLLHPDTPHEFLQDVRTKRFVIR